jgi:phosphatidylserine synthase
MNKLLIFSILASLFITISIICGLIAIYFMIENNVDKFGISALISILSGILGIYIEEEKL